MRYDFSGVTPERLTELFPIILTGHDPQWTHNYLIEKAFIERILGNENIVRISCDREFNTQFTPLCDH